MAERSFAAEIEKLRQGAGVAECQRLVKGYGDNHARGWGSFQAIMEEIDRGGTRLDAARVRALREAALADPEGRALRGALGAAA
jgi:indolepyruvate ferredoxin oxidoreductase beta subunit